MSEDAEELENTNQEHLHTKSPRIVVRACKLRNDGQQSLRGLRPMEIGARLVEISVPNSCRWFLCLSFQYDDPNQLFTSRTSSQR